MLNQSWQTIKVDVSDTICRIQLYRPDENNTINDLMVDECLQVLDENRDTACIVILEGLPEVFCFGADFKAFVAGQQTQSEHFSPEPLYALWTALATGPFISVAHVRGKVNAGGIGFVAACDIVLADTGAEFSLSELLFGLVPACVMPFLVRRVGRQRAHSMAIMTKTINVDQALTWGLVDACEPDSAGLLRKNLLRLRRINKTTIRRYKTYMNKLDDSLEQVKSFALAANKEVLGDQENISKITRYVNTGKFPWES
ncbi:MAG: enoyl-CoA hydratase [Alteromonadaceae bacterium]|nr:MAG: enoyl-CoA hydratase [Alteromonadaceae bacterium]